MTNPVVGEFFVQNKKEIGTIQTLTFINAKIQRTRIYLKAEHFNSSFTGIISIQHQTLHTVIS
jgi:hypothetical protein